MPHSAVQRILVLGVAGACFGVSLDACGGGVSGSAPAGAPPTPQIGATINPIGGANATGIIIIAVPSRPATANAAVRHAAYVSAGTTGAALFIDGATAPAGTTNTCASTCTIVWSAALALPGPHSFAIEIDNGSNVLAEGVKSYAIVSGNNGTLATMTLNGVAAGATQSGESCRSNFCNGTLTVLDAAGNAIVNTSTPLASGFDNGPLTFGTTNSAAGVISIGGSVSQPNANGTSPYTASCNGASTSFMTTLTPLSATGSGDVSVTERSARGLAYPSVISYFPTSYGCGSDASISDGRIYLVSQNANEVQVYEQGASGNATALQTIVGSNTGLNVCTGIALDAAGNIYVANYAASNIEIFAANANGNVAPIRTIGGSLTGLINPLDVIVDPSGKIFVGDANANTVSSFAANASGNVAPLSVIGGSNTLITYLLGLWLDPSGRIYVASYYNNTVAVFAAGANGNVAPATTISGNNTGLTGPYSIGLDSSGHVYVGNYPAGNTLIFAAGPNGAVNSAPIGTIGGGSTGLTGSAGFAFDASGRVYVTTYDGQDVRTFAADPTGNTTTGPLKVLNFPQSRGIVIR